MTRDDGRVHRGRGPKSAVPTRTSVEPSSSPISRSWVIPIEQTASSCRSTRERSRANAGRAASGGAVFTLTLPAV